VLIFGQSVTHTEVGGARDRTVRLGSGPRWVGHWKGTRPSAATEGGTCDPDISGGFAVAPGRAGTVSMGKSGDTTGRRRRGWTGGGLLTGLGYTRRCFRGTCTIFRATFLVTSHRGPPASSDPPTSRPALLQWQTGPHTSAVRTRPPWAYAGYKKVQLHPESIPLVGLGFATSFHYHQPHSSV
jgi:hypothetical protein